MLNEVSSLNLLSLYYLFWLSDVMWCDVICVLCGWRWIWVCDDADVGSLFEVYRKTPKSLTVSMIKKLSLDIVRGLIYIHTRKPSILHRGHFHLPLSLSLCVCVVCLFVILICLRVWESVNKLISLDLKSMNVLVTDDWIAKIADFGLSRSLQTKHLRASFLSSSATSSRWW